MGESIFVLAIKNKQFQAICLMFYYQLIRPALWLAVPMKGIAVEIIVELWPIPRFFLSDKEPDGLMSRRLKNPGPNSRVPDAKLLLELLPCINSALYQMFRGKHKFRRL